MIGDLRHLLTLESETLSDDGSGGFSPSWSSVASMWGSIEPTGADESTAADRTLATVTHRIGVRFRAGVLPKQRFVHAGRIFRIESVRDPDGRARSLVCDCKEEIAG